MHIGKITKKYRDTGANYHRMGVQLTPEKHALHVLPCQIWSFYMIDDTSIIYRAEACMGFRLAGYPQVWIRAIHRPGCKVAGTNPVGLGLQSCG